MKLYMRTVGGRGEKEHMKGLGEKVGYEEGTHGWEGEKVYTVQYEEVGERERGYMKRVGGRGMREGMWRVGEREGM